MFVEQLVIRVAVVEDDVVFLSDLVSAIKAAPDMRLASTASTVEEARRILEGPEVDVLVADLGLPDGSGIEIIRAAHQAWPRCAIMVATAFADELHVIQSIEAGASGYLLKDSSSSKLAEDIRSLHGGGSPISPMIARYVLARFRQVNAAVDVPESKLNDEGRTILSARELEVLRLITKGFTYDEIARLMKVSRNTVMTFVRRIYTKLEVKSKVEAIHEARSQGLLEG